MCPPEICKLEVPTLSRHQSRSASVLKRDKFLVMRRKYRPYVALGIGLYLLTMWSAFRWERSQHVPDGNIFDHIENERKWKFVEDQKKDEKKDQKNQPPTSTAESRINASPAFIAVRYDANHVVFMVKTDSELRIGIASEAIQKNTPQKTAVPAQASAHLAGLESYGKPIGRTLRRLPENVKDTVPGDERSLSISPDSTIPVTITRAVTAPTGCSMALGFLASVPEKQQPGFATPPEEYFVVRRTPVVAAESALVTPLRSHRRNPLLFPHPPLQPAPFPSLSWRIGSPLQISGLDRRCWRCIRDLSPSLQITLGTLPLCQPRSGHCRGSRTAAN